MKKRKMKLLMSLSKELKKKKKFLKPKMNFINGKRSYLMISSQKLMPYKTNRC
jgi:hypothetical protein